MGSTPLRINTEVDLTGLNALSAGMSKSGAEAAKLAAEFKSMNYSADQAAAALKQVGMSAAVSAQVMSLMATETKAAAQVLDTTTNSMGGLERAVAMAGARMTGQLIPGFGMAGYQIGKVATMLPGMGALFAAALPVALIAFAVQQIEAWRLALEKTRNEMTQLAVTARDQADAIELDNLKLGDEAATLENRPKQNLMKEALVETRIESDKLAEAIGNDLTKLETLFRAGPGMISSFLFGSPDEAKVADQLKPLDRAYQLAVLSNDAVAQHNTLLQAQSVLEKAIADVHTTYKLPASDPAAKAEAERNAAALQDYKAGLSAISSLLKAQGEQSTRNAETIKVAGEQQRKDNEDFWAKYSAGFKQEAEELSRHAEFWKRFYTDQVSEEQKSVAERQRVEEEGARETQELMTRVQEQRKRIDDENRRHADEMASLAQRGEDVSAPKGIAGLNQQVAAARAAAQQEASAWQQQAAQEVVTQQEAADHIAEIWAKEANQEAAIHKKLLDEWQASMNKIVTGPFESMINKVVMGQERIGRAFAQMGAQIVSNLVQSLTKMAVAWIEHWALVEILNATGLATVNTQTAIANSKGVVSNAAKAASNAYADVPFPLNLIAAPAVFAAVIGLEGMAGSAEQGAVLPKDMAIFAHAQEMILPAPISKGLQDAFGGGRGASGAGGGVTVNQHFSAIDGRSTAQFLRSNRKSMMKQIRTAVRNGGFARA